MVAAAFACCQHAAAAEPARPDAGPSEMTLTWKAPPGCPSGDAAAADLAALLGTDVRVGPEDGGHAGQPRGTTAASVTLTALDRGRIRADIATRGPGASGERSFEGGACARVAEAALLVVALTYDPLGVARQLVKPGTPPPPFAGDRVSVGARVAGDLGSLPAGTLGFGVLLGAHDRAGRLEAEADLWISRIARNGPHPDSGGDIALATGALRGCVDLWQIPNTDLRLGPCVGIEVGVSSGQGLGVARPQKTRGLWGAALAGLTLSQSEGAGGRLRPWISLDVGGAFVRPTFGIDGFGDVFTASPLVARAALGVAWMFP